MSIKEVANNRMMGKKSDAKGQGRKPPLAHKITCSTCGQTFTKPGDFSSHMPSCKGKTR